MGSVNTNQQIRNRRLITGETLAQARAAMSTMAKAPDESAPIAVTAKAWGGLEFREFVFQPWDGDGQMRGGSDAASKRHDNTRRAGFAISALYAYLKASGGEEESVLTDLLSDLRHLCDALGEDFDAEVLRSAGHHDVEVRIP